MSVSQRDPHHEQGTNAKVLAYLLQPENDSYMVTHENNERQTTLGLLRLVTEQRPEICVVLDVGAQILDLSNLQVVKVWLDLSRDVAGALYFNENDELMVFTRSGITQPLSSSPLSQQLERCIVYLDHAHTRGTDLRFPIGSRAAVTLGPKMTKDNLVQGSYLFHHSAAPEDSQLVTSRVHEDAQAGSWSLGNVFCTTRG